MTPTFYIKSVTMFQARNKAQEKVIAAVENLQGLTLKDVDDLQEFKNYLNDVAAEAAERFPNAKPIVVDVTVLIDGTRHISLESEGRNPHVVAIVEISYIRGEWKKGGRK